jgi:hypothetical protein
MVIPNLNGATVIYRNGTIFVPLPRELWRPITGGCHCSEECKANGAYWDTLAIGAEPQRKGSHTDHAWLVHNPSAHR